MANAKTDPSKTSDKQAQASPVSPPARDELGRLLPGNTANPNGRPRKEHSLTDTLKELMDEQPDLKRALITKVIEKAISGGDMNALKLIWSYTDGAPINTTELTGKGGKPIELTAVPYDQLLAEARALGISTTDYESLNPGTSDRGTATQDRPEE